MPITLPSYGALCQAFSPGNPSAKQQTQFQPKRSKYQARSDLYPAWSVADDAKGTAQQLSDAAVKQLETASQKAQSQAGRIELYSPKYYAACTFGGLMACVRPLGPMQKS